MNWKALRATIVTLFVPLGLIGLIYYVGTSTGLIASIIGYGLLALLMVGLIGVIYLVYDEEDNE